MSEPITEVEELLESLEELDVSQHTRVLKEVHRTLTDELNRLEA